MDIGMLWRDEDHQRTLDEKVARAVEYYRHKYGEVPTVCFVHPQMLPDGAQFVGGVRLLTAKNILLNHFWLGVNEAPSARHARVNGDAAS